MSRSALGQFYARLKQWGDGDVSALCRAADGGDFSFYYPEAAEHIYGDFVDKIMSCLGSLTEVVTNPYIVLKNEYNALRTERVSMLTPEGVRKTVADSRIWKKSNDGMRPEYAYSRTAEDEYDTYENRLVKTLIDRLLTIIAAPLEETRSGIKNLYGDVKETRSTAGKIDMARLMDENIFVDNDKRGFDGYRRLFYIKAKLRQLRNSAFYKMTDRLPPFSDAVPQVTNLFTHNTDYNKCMKLWLYLGEYMQKSGASAQGSEYALTAPERKAAYSAFVYLIAADALERLGFTLSGGEFAVREGIFTAQRAFAENEYFVVALDYAVGKITLNVQLRATGDKCVTVIDAITEHNEESSGDYAVSMLPLECSDKRIYVFPDSRNSISDLQTVVKLTTLVVPVTENVYDKICMICGNNAVEEKEGGIVCADCGARYCFVSPSEVWIKHFNF